MRPVFALVLALFAGMAAGVAGARQVPTPPQRDVSLIGSRMPEQPASPRHDDASVPHGVTVEDPYRWLENPADPAQFKAMLAYSPLQNVKPRTAYPALLLTTGANDPRVAPWQSRKFAAALQNATTSNQPILLLTRMDAGHAIGAPFSQRVGNTALMLAFFAQELGLPAK